MRKEFEMAFTLSAIAGGSFGSTFARAQSQITALQRQVVALNQTQSDIQAYERQQRAVDATQKKLEVLQQQYDNIQKEIQETGTFSSDLENKLLAKRQQIEKTTQSLGDQTDKLNKMGSALRDAGVDTNDLAGSSEKLREKVEQLKKEENELADEADTFGKKMEDAFGAAAEAMVAAKLAEKFREIAEAAAECVRVAGDFQSTMSTVEALSGANADELAKLSAKAKDLGATTAYTATQAAEAMTYMGMAGWDAQEMLAGMSGVINLAAASGEDLAMVSDIVTDNLTAFGLTASDTSRFADVLAAAATNSNTSVGIMGETFKNAASIAGALGYSVEDVSVAVGLMANSGVKGSRAGTALRNVFNGLLQGVTLTGEALGSVDYTTVRANGTMKSFSETVRELRGYFEQMSEAERVNNAMAIAGQRGYNGLLAILNSTDKDFQSLTQSIEQSSGAAQRMADIKLDNYNGQATLMRSALDAVKTTVGEALIPTLTKLAESATKILTSVNAFLKAHPGLIKGITVLIGGLGGIVTAIVSISAAIKVFEALNLAAIFAGPLGPVIALSGAVVGLTAALVALDDASKADVPSIKELTEAARGLDDAMRSADRAMEDTATETMATAAVAESYIDALDRLAPTIDSSTEDHDEYMRVLQLLVQTCPELAEQIDLTTGAIRGGTEALRDNLTAWEDSAKAAAYQQYIQSLQETYNDVLVEQATNQIKLTQANAKADKATRGMASTYEKLLDAMGLTDEQFHQLYTSVDDIPWRQYGQNVKDLRDEYDRYAADLSEAEQTQRNVERALEDSADAVAEAQEALEGAKSAYEEIVGPTDAAAESTAALAEETATLEEAILSALDEVASLADKYNEAYAAARNSVEGQYELWDKAKDVVGTAVTDINANLDSQISYWESYNSNLEALSERTGDIEGLSNVIASFADGSEESVNAIAGMASASDEELTEMVKSWQKLRDEENLVEQSIAELKTNFTAEMDDLVSELEADIDEMNFSAEAVEAAQDTIQGYINGVESMLPAVAAAYTSVARVGKNAYKTEMDQHSPSRAMEEEAYWTWAGYINETKRLMPEIRDVFAAAAGAGLSGVSSSETVMSSGVGAAPVSVSVTFAIDGSASPETVDALQAYGDSFAERVLAVVAEAEADARRGAYT